MQMKVLKNDLKSQAAEMLDVDPTVFGAKMNSDMVHQVVNAYRAAGRAGTKSTKSRSDVAGGGKKPWKQKGTGRARAGTTRSPIWVGGGKTFADCPRSYEQKVNRKMYRGAMRSILSELERREAILIVEDFALDTPKCKDLLSKLSAISAKRIMVVASEMDENLFLASRNLEHIAAMDVDGLNPLSLFWADKLVLTKAAAISLQERLK